MKACPYRKDFYLKLAGGDESAIEKAAAQLKEWLEALEKIVEIIVKFYVDGKYE